jgi:N-acetylmuramoyl-L-alanine amidase
LKKRTKKLLHMNIIELPSPNTDERPNAVDMLILHYTGMQTAQAAIDRLRDPIARVSSHYVIDEDGTIIRLVQEERRAWHAGISYWRGRRTLNDGSIGIEIVNPGHEWGYRPFPEVQLDAVRALCLDILGRHAIPPINVVGHSDVAPDRKQDPGELFPWRQFANDGIGLWPKGDGGPGDFAQSLAAIGYDVDPALSPPAAVITAFQRHWHPEHVTGQASDGTIARAIALAETVAASAMSTKPTCLL